ncbi:MAG: penicillin acylase family protein [Candidatus Kapaibacteriota bacterium]
MSKLTRTIAIFSSLIIISFFIVVFIFKISKVTPDNSEIALNCNKLQEQVTIRYNKIGIPHIYSNNESDLFFGIGYASAENRLWQMDYLRRIPQGRLSEIFGSKFILTDKFFRALDFKTIVESTWNQLNPQSKLILENYANGVNFFIDKNSSNLPLEFSLLNYQPEKWSPKDCLYIIKLIAFEYNTNFWSDIIFGEIAEKYGNNFAEKLIPQTKFNAIEFFDSTKMKELDKKLVQLNNQSLKKENSFANELRLSLEQINALPRINGCNAWAIKKNVNGKTKATLANDIHTNLSLPSFWFETIAISPTFVVSGALIPGIPLFLIGRNDFISWGITNMMLDGSDFFKEIISKDGKSFLSKDSTYQPLKFIIDTLFVKGQNPIRYYQRKSDKSIILSDFAYVKNNYSLKDKTINKWSKNTTNITFRWVGQKPSDEFFCLYKLNKSRNWDEFQNSLTNWGSPALNFHYADIEGNIGMKPSGYIPVREINNLPNFYNLTSIKNNNWSDITNISSKLSIYNPKNNFVASANHYFSDSTRTFISSIFASNSRITRINQYLTQFKDFEIRDMQKMQNDNYSYFAKDILSICLPIIYKYNNLLNKHEQDALNRLSKWDYLESSNKISPSIFNSFIVRILENTFLNKLDKNLFWNYISIPDISYNKLEELLKSNDNFFFDDIHTQTYENKDFIVFKSFKDAIALLDNLYKTKDINKWNWGKIHKLQLTHILNNSKLFEPTFNSPSFEMSGSYTTINKQGWNYDELFKISNGVSFRFITDMSDSNIYVSLPGGVSGDPTNIFYNNQLRIFINGGYFKLVHSKIPIKSNNIRFINK